VPEGLVELIVLLTLLGAAVAALAVRLAGTTAPALAAVGCWLAALFVLLELELGAVNQPHASWGNLAIAGLDFSTLRPLLTYAPPLAAALAALPLALLGGRLAGSRFEFRRNVV